MKNKKETRKRKISKDQKKILHCLAIFLIGILIWLIPTLIASGFIGYFDAVLGQFLRRFSSSEMSTLGGNILSFDYLFLRAKKFLGFFLAEGYGINLWEFKIGYAAALLIYLFFLFISYEKLKDKRIMFFITGLVFYTVMVILFLTPQNPRYFLPLIPFISLLFVLGFSWFGKYNYLAFVFLFILLLVHSTPLTKEIHTVKAAPVQLIEYIQENYDLNEVIILNMNPRYLNYYNLEYHSSFELSKNEFDENKTILFIKLNNPNEPGDYFFQRHNATLIKVFYRDLRVHPKQNIVHLYEIYGVNK